MDIQSIIDTYSTFKEKTLENRFFKHHDVVKLIEKLPKKFKTSFLGNSARGKSLNAIEWGNGKTKVMLWSQMHGDEATGTMALFDLLNFLQIPSDIQTLLEEHCQLLILPMVNPDGAAAFKRRNAQQIDINRDFLQQASPEAKILKKCRDDFNPQFGFNLHDQNTLWSVNDTLKPATLSFLAPAFDKDLSIDNTRKDAMLVIADLVTKMNVLLPKQIALFDDEHEPRAFGDNFQKAGTSTILIEAGGLVNDPEKQKIRELYFASILNGLISIASKNYSNEVVDGYFAIPKNNKQIFHILIHNVSLGETLLSVGINFDECPDLDGNKTSKIYQIQDIGDLSFCDAYHTFDAKDAIILGDIVFEQKANFTLTKNEKIILAFKNGELLQKH